MSTLTAGTTSSSTESTRRVTPEELLALPDAVRYELVNGQLVERSMGTESSWVGGELMRLLGNHAVKQNLGWLLPPDGSYQCFPDSPEMLRAMAGMSGD